MNLIEVIPMGKENIIDRHELLDRFIAFGAVEGTSKDPNREMMTVIHELRKNAVIISTGKGYYRPSIDDMQELENYIRKEEHRVKEIVTNTQYAKKYLQDMKVGRL